MTCWWPLRGRVLINPLVSIKAGEEPPAKRPNTGAQPVPRGAGPATATVLSTTTTFTTSELDAVCIPPFPPLRPRVAWYIIS
jgi:hypothetical protein